MQSPPDMDAHGAGQPRLQTIVEGPRAQDPAQQPAFTIIAVPDFEVRSVRSWQDGAATPWLLDSLLSPSRPTTVLAFEPGLACGKQFSWQTVVHYGDALLQELQDWRAHGRLPDCAIVFVCHGLAGLVLKRALCIASEQFYKPAFRELGAMFAGVVLLGCPNLRAYDQRDQDRLSTLFKFVTKHRSRAALPRDGIVAAQVSQRFSEVGFEVPVLSVYEMLPAKVTRGLFSPRIVLVDRETCETLTKCEQTIGAELSHGELPHIRIGSPLWRKISNFVGLSLQLHSVNAQLAHSGPKGSAARRRGSADGEGLVDPVLDDLTTDFASLAGRASRSAPLAPGAPSGVRLGAHALNRRPRTQYYTMPEPPVHSFISRPDVFAKLDESLLPTSGTLTQSTAGLRSFALCGCGGIGKTQVAASFAYERKSHFDAIFWMPATDTGVLAASFANLAITLGLVDAAAAIPDDVVILKIVHNWLLSASDAQESARGRKGHGYNWLMVFDNVENITVIRDYFPPSDYNGALLITSRDPLAMATLYSRINTGLELPPLATDDAAGWLVTIVLQGQQPSDDDLRLAEDIVHRLSRLPLAIAQAAGAMLRRGLSFAEFLTFYEQESFRADIYQSDLFNQQPIWATFAFQELSPGAASLLSMICFFNPDGVPESIFLSSDSGKQLARELDLTGFPMRDMEYINARTELTSISLVRRNTNTQTLSVHRLIQDAAMLHIGIEQLGNAFRVAVRMLSTTWPERQFNYHPTLWQLSEPLLPHVARCLTQYETHRALQDLKDVKAELAGLLQRVAWYRGERGAHHASLAQGLMALRLAKEAPVHDSLLLWACHMTLAELCVSTCDFESALKFGSCAQKLVEEDIGLRLGGELRGFGPGYMTYLSLSEARMGHQQWDQAIEMCDLAVLTKAQDSTGRDALPAIINKAHCLWRKGLPDLAWTEASRVWLDPMADDPAYPIKVALTLYEQGNIREAQKEWEQSFELHRNAFQKMTGLFGQGHFRVAAAATKVGQHHQRRGEWQAAKSYYVSSLENYSDRPQYAVEICRTKWLLVHVLEQLQDASAEYGKAEAEQKLLELCVKFGRNISEEDLTSVIAYWAV